MSAADFSDFDEDMFAHNDAHQTVPTSAGDLKKGHYVVCRGAPCKIVEVEHAKNGKHGAAKAIMNVEDIFTGRKYEISAPCSATLAMPVVTKHEFLLIDVDADGRLSLLDDANEERRDLNLPEHEEEDLCRVVRAHHAAGDASVILVSQKAMGIEAIVSFKLDTGR